MGQQRGRLTPLPERQKIVSLVIEAVGNGARKTRACQCIAISIRTFQRCIDGEIINADRRPDSTNHCPRNKLSEIETQQILELCNSSKFASLPPNVIVTTLADNGIYIVSESYFYRILRSANQLTGIPSERQYRRPGHPQSFRSESSLELGHQLNPIQDQRAALLFVHDN